MRNCASQASIILVDAQSGERTILFRRDDRVALRESDVPPEWVRECRLVHVDGHNAGAGTYAARLARRAGVLTMADLDHVYPGIPALLREVDYPVTSQAFLMQFTGERDLPRAMQQFRAQYQSRAVCSTLGIGGAVLWDGARFWYSPSYRVQVVDTTGAGDVFHAVCCKAGSGSASSTSVALRQGSTARRSARARGSRPCGQSDACSE